MFNAIFENGHTNKYSFEFEIAPNRLVTLRVEPNRVALMYGSKFRTDAWCPESWLELELGKLTLGAQFTGDEIFEAETSIIMYSRLPSPEQFPAPLVKHPYTVWLVALHHGYAENIHGHRIRLPACVQSEADFACISCHGSAKLEYQSTVSNFRQIDGLPVEFPRCHNALHQPTAPHILCQFCFHQQVAKRTHPDGTAEESDDEVVQDRRRCPLCRVSYSGYNMPGHDAYIQREGGVLVLEQAARLKLNSRQYWSLQPKAIAERRRWFTPQNGVAYRALSRSQMQPYAESYDVPYSCPHVEAEPAENQILSVKDFQTLVPITSDDAVNPFPLAEDISRDIRTHMRTALRYLTGVSANDYAHVFVDDYFYVADAMPPINRFPPSDGSQADRLSRR